MSLVHSYVINYTENSNFDEVSVYDALENYLTAGYRISFEIRVCFHPCPFLAMGVVLTKDPKIGRNRAPIIKTDYPLSSVCVLS